MCYFDGTCEKRFGKHSRIFCVLFNTSMTQSVNEVITSENVIHLSWLFIVN